MQTFFAFSLRGQFVYTYIEIMSFTFIWVNSSQQLMHFAILDISPRYVIVTTFLEYIVLPQCFHLYNRPSNLYQRGLLLNLVRGLARSGG